LVGEVLEFVGRPTRERAAIAARAVTEAKAAGRLLAKDVLADFTEIFKSMATKWARLRCTDRAFPVAHVSCVAVMPPDKAPSDDVTVTRR
jgi:hypothetical protein